LIGGALVQLFMKWWLDWYEFYCYFQFNN